MRDKKKPGLPPKPEDSVREGGLTKTDTVELRATAVTTHYIDQRYTGVGYDPTWTQRVDYKPLVYNDVRAFMHAVAEHLGEEDTVVRFGPTGCTAEKVTSLEPDVTVNGG